MTIMRTILHPLRACRTYLSNWHNLAESLPPLNQTVSLKQNIHRSWMENPYEQMQWTRARWELSLTYMHQAPTPVMPMHPYTTPYIWSYSCTPIAYITVQYIYYVRPHGCFKDSKMPSNYWCDYSYPLLAKSNHNHTHWSIIKSDAQLAITPVDFSCFNLLFLLDCGGLEMHDMSSCTISGGCGDWGCTPNPDSSHINGMHIKGVWQPLYEVTTLRPLMPTKLLEIC